MAQCAREKLQASARDFWSSIRSFDDAAKKHADDSTQPTENAAVMSLERIENVLKIMFNSCTTGAVPETTPENEPTSSAKDFEKRSRSSRSRDFVSGEHVYAQLFMDDQARATRAVDGLRERAASSPRSRASARLKQSTPSPQVSNNGPPTSRDLDISNDLSFDDGISAISAHTLEEMARIHDHKSTFYSQNKLADKSISKVETISYTKRNPVVSPSQAQPASTKVISPPVKFTRGRSSGTTGSKSTKSTRSSQDSEFASVWKKEERKYWDDVVQQDKKSFAMSVSSSSKLSSLSKKGRRRSRCGGSLSVSSNVYTGCKSCCFLAVLLMIVFSSSCSRPSKTSPLQQELQRVPPPTPTTAPTLTSTLIHTMLYSSILEVSWAVKKFSTGSFPSRLWIPLGSRNVW
jgi:hypothetical protein